MKVVSLENLSKYNELLNQKTVRSVNSVKPDSNGNVTLEIPQAIGVSRFPDYEHPITVFDVVNKGFIQDVNFDYVFPEDGYFHYRLLAEEGKYYDVIIVGSLTVNGNVVDLYERSRSPAGSSFWTCINDLIPVPKGSVLHIGFLQCDADANNVIEFFPLKNGNVIQADEVTGVVKSVNSIAPDENGNVEITTSGAIQADEVTGVVKSVNSIAPDENGNVEITTSGAIESYRRSNKWTADKLLITTPNKIFVNVNDRLYTRLESITIDISKSESWDDTTAMDYTVASNRAGKDFYIYAVETEDLNTVKFLVSANSTVPVGYTADNSRKIAGFHCLCLGVGTIANHPASGYLTGDIIPNSVWDLSFKSKNIYGNEGQVYVDCQDLWVAIYLPSWDGSKIVSKFGGVIIDGASSTAMDGEQFAEFAGLVGGRLPSRDEFKVFAFGSNQLTAIKGTTDPNTTGGHVDSNNRRMISDYFIEDCCGAMWQWSSDCYEAMSTSWNGNTWMEGYSWQTVPTYSTIGDVNHRQLGSCAGLLRRALLGGYWGDGSCCGSRCVNCADFGSRVASNFSGRLVFGTKTELV